MDIENINILSQTITAYLFELKTFIKSFKTCRNDNSIQIIFTKSDELEQFSEELTKKDFEANIKSIEKIRDLSDILLSELKSLRCLEDYLNEKEDLSAKTFMIWEKCNKILSSQRFS
jgi:hypothetical protein